MFPMATPSLLQGTCCMVGSEALQGVSVALTPYCVVGVLVCAGSEPSAKLSKPRGAVRLGLVFCDHPDQPLGTGLPALHAALPYSQTCACRFSCTSLPETSLQYI